MMPAGAAALVGTANSVTLPDGVIRPIRLPMFSVNQRLPSGPAVMLCGPLAALGMENSVMRVGLDALATPTPVPASATSGSARASDQRLRSNLPSQESI